MEEELNELVEQLAEKKALEFQFLEFEYNEETGNFDPLHSDENDEIISLLFIFGSKCLAYCFSKKDEPHSSNNDEISENISDNEETNYMQFVEAEYYKSKEETSNLICDIIMERNNEKDNYDYHRVIDLKENIRSDLDRFDGYIGIAYNYISDGGSQSCFFEYLNGFDF